MKTNVFKLTLFLILLVNFEVHSQELFHELSIGVGPVSFRGDYGQSQDNETNLKNTGIGIYLAHYLNFSYISNCGYSSNCGSYFEEHFKLRTQILYQNTNLKHSGRYTDGTSEGAAKLRTMTGEVNSFEIGTGLQWYYKNIKNYQRNFNTLSPYAGFGIGAVFSNPSSDTSLPGNLGSVTNTFPTFLPQPGEENPISNDSESALALNFQLGTQYRLTQNSDVFAELRFHFYNSDFVDGLAPIGDQNESDDRSVWLSLGYVYYFESF